MLKWNFTTPREEFVEQLRDQMNTAGVNKTLITNMFHPDFKFHLKAIDSLLEVRYLRDFSPVNHPAISHLLIKYVSLCRMWRGIRKH